MTPRHLVDVVQHGLASRGVPLVLSPKEAVSAGLYDALEAKGPFGTVTLLGGTAALSETVAGQLSGLLR